MRARLPDQAGYVERGGVRLGYEVFGDDAGPTILLLPTWTIIHSRFWKMQVPYLSRHFRVITYDGPGNGRSDRVTDPERYGPISYAEDAAAVLEATSTDRAIVVGLSLGGQYGAALAVAHPERVAGLVMIGPSIPLTPPSPERAAAAEGFGKPYPDGVEGWGKYNLAYWHDHYADFAQFFFGQCFNEPHSTKPIEDSVGWALEAGPEILEAEWAAPILTQDWPGYMGRVQCPTLVIHGTRDRISPHARGVEAARLTGAVMLSMEGSGHIPNVRDPVKVNLAIRDFVERVAS